MNHPENYEKKIFCIGLARTGTTSLHEILKSLGLKSNHFAGEILYQDNWNIINKYDAFSDTPIPFIYKKLDSLHPGSKFILTTRNKRSWLKSMKWMFKHGKVIWNWPSKLNEYHLKFYGCSKYEKTILSQFYRKYHKDTKDYFRNRENDYLEINIDNGFDISELCKFLDIKYKPVSPFHSNSKRNATLIEKLNYYLSLS